MKTFKGSIEFLAQTYPGALQLAQCHVGTTGEDEEIPDDWVYEGGYDHVPSVGKESGFTFLTPKGWLACKARIKEAFDALAPGPRGMTWEEYERLVEENFAKARKSTNNKIALLTKKLDELRIKSRLLA